MEYVDGKTLKQLDDSMLNSANVLQILYQVLLVMETLQSMRICHNDLNASNVMLTRDGHMKIIDFGQSKALLPKRTSKVIPKNSSKFKQQESFKWTQECQDARKFSSLVQSLNGKYSE